MPGRRNFKTIVTPAAAQDKHNEEQQQGGSQWIEWQRSDSGQRPERQRLDNVQHPEQQFLSGKQQLDDHLPVSKLQAKRGKQKRSKQHFSPFPLQQHLHRLAKRLPYRPRAPTANEQEPVEQLVNYDQYTLTRMELVRSLVSWSALLIFITYSFYQSIQLSLLVTPLSFLMLSYDRQRLTARRKQRMRLQLKDVLMSLVSSLAVGRSLENCFAVASDDMAMLYPHSKVELIAELDTINHRIRNGESLEQSLQQLAQRTNIEEFTQFVEALQTCKRSGGDLLAVMRRTATMLSDQITVDNEIQVLLAQKKLEGRIMMAAPFAFLQFFHSMSPAYMEALRTPLGYVLLSIVLLLLLLLFWLMDKIMTIKM